MVAVGCAVPLRVENSGVAVMVGGLTSWSMEGPSNSFLVINRVIPDLRQAVARVLRRSHFFIYSFVHASCAPAVITYEAVRVSRGGKSSSSESQNRHPC